MTNTTAKTPVEKLREHEENRKAFMAHVEEENKKFEARRQELIREERERKQREEQEWRDNLVKEIMHEYGFNQAVAEAVVKKGWEDGHAYGYSEVHTCSQIAAEFAETILKSVELVSR